MLFKTYEYKGEDSKVLWWYNFKGTEWDFFSFSCNYCFEICDNRSWVFYFIFLNSHLRHIKSACYFLNSCSATLLPGVQILFSHCHPLTSVLTFIATHMIATALQIFPDSNLAILHDSLSSSRHNNNLLTIHSVRNLVLYSERQKVTREINTCSLLSMTL